MKTLVIHPKDETTDFLNVIYSGRDWTVINTTISKKSLREQIKAHDRIVMMGHGSKDGLFDLKNKRFVIDSTWVYLLREKQLVCIWCNANLFVEKYGLNGFYTGMIISEFVEALQYHVITTSAEIAESNSMFANAVKKSIDDAQMISRMCGKYKAVNKVTTFNAKNLFERKGDCK